MYVSDLALTDFRSYPEVVLSLDPGITTFVGRNGQGKTNLIEAIGYLSTFSSHRVASDTALVRFGAARAIAQAKVVRGGRPSVLEIEIVSGRANRARLNRSPVRPRELLGLVRTVLFAPEDLALVKGDPDGRRRFCDDLLVLLGPRIAGVRSDYERVVKQRNALLRSAVAARRGSGRSDLSTLDVWNDKAAAAGAELVVARIDLLRQLRPHVQTGYEQVSDGQGVAEMVYRSSIQDPEPVMEADLVDVAVVKERLLGAMDRLRDREIERGVSLVGPHRDDVELVLGGLPAKGYASHGESWSFALALRLASYQVLMGEGSWEADGEPVLMLDDVFAELDSRRRERLAELVAPAEQVLITAAVPDDVPSALAGARVAVAEGSVSRV